jgi:hypothetical protein
MVDNAQTHNVKYLDKRIRHKLNKLMKSSPIYNKLQHYLIQHAAYEHFSLQFCNILSVLGPDNRNIGTLQPYRIPTDRSGAETLS